MGPPTFVRHEVGVVLHRPPGAPPSPPSPRSTIDPRADAWVEQSDHFESWMEGQQKSSTRRADFGRMSLERRMLMEDEKEGNQIAGLMSVQARHTATSSPGSHGIRATDITMGQLSPSSVVSRVPRRLSLCSGELPSTSPRDKHQSPSSSSAETFLVDDRGHRLRPTSPRSPRVRRILHSSKVAAPPTPALLPPHWCPTVPTPSP